MLRKHTNDDATPVIVTNKQPEKGPQPCPQTGCQETTGAHPYSSGFVVYEIFGGFSGDYVTSLPCKCCDAKGFLYDGEIAYQRYCTYHGVRDISTGYPNPISMSKQLYDSITLKVREVKVENKNEACYIATAVYGDYNSPEVLVFRKFRDEILIKSLFGVILVRAYYKTSPLLLRYLGNNFIFLVPAKKILDLIYKKLK